MDFEPRLIPSGALRLGIEAGGLGAELPRAFFLHSAAKATGVR
jgi:hypothetical protein